MVQLNTRPASVHRLPNPPPWFVTPFDRTNEYSCCNARPARLNMNGYQRLAIVNAFRLPVLPGSEISIRLLGHMDRLPASDDDPLRRNDVLALEETTIPLGCALRLAKGIDVADRVHLQGRHYRDPWR